MLKYKPKNFSNESEADMISYASKMEIKTPHVYGCVEGPEDWTIFVSDFVSGDTLLNVWPRLNNVERTSIKEQLKKQLEIMRQCRMPYIGRVGKQTIKDAFDPIRFSFAGPFMAEKAFNQWSFSQIGSMAERLKWKITLSTSKHSEFFVLTHGDLFSLEHHGSRGKNHSNFGLGTELILPAVLQIRLVCFSTWI